MCQRKLAKCGSKDGLDNIQNVWGIANDFIDVVEGVANPLNWLNLFSDGLTLFGKGQNRDNSSQKLDEIQNMLNNMGGTLDQIRGIVGDTNANQQDIIDMLNDIMGQQQANTAEILDAINGVSSQLSHMWGNIQNWFVALQQQLNAMQGMLKGLVNAMRELFDKVEELETHVDWGSIVGSLTEYQLRIAYAVEIAQNMSTVPDKSSRRRKDDQGDDDDDGNDPTPIRYDVQELNKWARKTCDLATGLSYYLYALNRLILGNAIGGRPLTDLYFPLFECDPNMGPWVGRFHGYLVALQAQGFGVLGKARQYLGMAAD